ncbi:MAG: HAMP domain-containing protein [Oligoflexia bacterium]|nr:HAMP domain-containing protein [Oligoflexia bacterium]
MVNRKKRVLVWWRKSGMGLRLTFFLLAIGLLASLLALQHPQEDTQYAGRNLLFFILVNLNVIIICVLAFLIGRNVVKLIFDRRRNILGAKLKLRLAVAFVALSMVPTVFLFLLASGLLNRVMEGWFSNQIERSVTGAVEVARYHFATLKENTQSVAERIAGEISALPNGQSTEQLADWAEARRKEAALYGLRLIRQDGEPIFKVFNAAASISTFREPELDSGALQKALDGARNVLYEEHDASQYVRAYLPIQFAGQAAALVATTRVNPELVQALGVVNDSYKEYEQLKLFRMPIKSSVLLTLGMITGLILFAAIWIGFYIAREIAVPIQRLAEGTRAVAKGNLDFQIRVAGDDEIGLLVQLFNQMTADLKASREDVQQRRLYIETILSNLAVGVIGLDTSGCITSINSAAAELFSLADPASMFGRQWKEALRPEIVEQISPLLEALASVGADPEELAVREHELSVAAGGRELKVVCTLGRIIDSRQRVLGTVLLFDDVTELTKAQHMSVWREVARRIAHEIKNPLTPIQLSAQRLKRLIADSDQSQSVHECAQTIVENVDSIKRLANEFSNFARMPTAEFTLGNLNTLIADAIAPFAESHSDIVFQFIADSRMPELSMDREQIRRCVMNLVDNAIAALERDSAGASRAEGPKIVVRTYYDKRTKLASIEVADNGPGVPDSDKTRIFEPYFTTKPSGSGLGLAIVTSIVADHQGKIRVYDNKPRGAKFIVDLPLAPKVQTQRRLASA